MLYYSKTLCASILVSILTTPLGLLYVLACSSLDRHGSKCILHMFVFFRYHLYSLLRLMAYSHSLLALTLALIYLPSPLPVCPTLACLPSYSSHSSLTSPARSHPRLLASVSLSLIWLVLAHLPIRPRSHPRLLVLALALALVLAHCSPSPLPMPLPLPSPDCSSLLTPALANSLALAS
ncbi:hypothetical protein C8Q78DRAFT_1064171, partial [Trametes maxima]